MNICHYAIVRFRPFPETGEFANVGIVALEPRTGAIQYRLSRKRFRRVTQFFSDLDPKLFSTAIRLYESELSRVRKLAATERYGVSSNLFASVVRSRETVILCSEIRSASFEAPFEKFIEQLFDRYVGRNFVTDERRENIMVHEIKKRLERARLFGFREHKIDDPLVPVTFQLASQPNHELYVIKPFAFDQQKPLDIIDHAGKWRDRFGQLFARKKLDPKKVLLTVEPPTLDREHVIFEAFDAARSQLATLPVKMIDHQNEVELFSFARKGAEPQTSFVM